MDIIRLIFSKQQEYDLRKFFRQNCIYEYEESDKFSILPDGTYYEYMDEYTYVVCQRSASLIKCMGDLVMWELNISENENLAEIHAFLEKVLTGFYGYALDDRSDYLWTWEDIKNRHKAFGQCFFDRYAWKYLSGPYMHIGIMDDPMRKNEFASFQEEVDYYQCICLPDTILDDWWDGLNEMDTYFHELSRPNSGFARWGITLIPPQSHDLFARIIRAKTDPHFLKEYSAQIAALLAMLRKARREGKYLIHFGV